jgi:hypothetical protein
MPEEHFCCVFDGTGQFREVFLPIIPTIKNNRQTIAASVMRRIQKCLSIHAKDQAIRD